jgi:hypothetical protein
VVASNTLAVAMRDGFPVTAVTTTVREKSPKFWGRALSKEVCTTCVLCSADSATACAFFPVSLSRARSMCSAVTDQ